MSAGSEHKSGARPVRIEDRTSGMKGSPGRHWDGAIAIVGMACRFPASPDLAAFWRHLEAGGDAVQEGAPGSGKGRVGELFATARSGPDPRRFGAFIEGLDRFDAAFFGVSEAEARLMDPQQRLLLEVGWHALEHAGIAPDSLRGSRGGVYVGIGNSDYRELVTREHGASVYAATGTSASTAAGRIAYVLGLEGPAMSVDTASSASLVAVHQAVAALQAAEVDLALAGGVNAIVAPGRTEMFANGGMLSPDGRCRSFDVSANGYVRGEGCGLVVLKRLSSVAAGDRVLAVIRGSTVNQDGASAGLTVPRASSQERVIEEALARAGIEPAEVDYLEAHGSGTPVGDPIELQAALGAYGRDRADDSPLLVGSVKTNIGHLEAAAGVAGLIKVVLSMGAGLIPKHLHFRTPSPRIAWADLPVRVVTEATGWPGGPDRPMRAGVSSFGLSGTNAHVVVEGAPAREGGRRGIPRA